MAEEQLRAQNDIFKDFVKGVADVEGTVGVGWSIVENEEWAIRLGFLCTGGGDERFGCKDAKRCGAERLTCQA